MNNTESSHTFCKLYTQQINIHCFSVSFKSFYGVWVNGLYDDSNIGSSMDWSSS